MRTALRKPIACLAAAAAMAASTVASAQQPVNLNIGSFIQGSGWYVYAVNLAELLRQSLPPGSKVDSPPVAGAVGNIRLVNEGKADLAFGMALVGNWASKGIVAFDKKPVPTLRALAGGWDRYYLFSVAAGKDLGPQFDKFLHKDRPATRISLLPRGGVGPVGAQQMLALMDSDEEAVRKRGGSYDFASFDAAKGRFASRTVDLFMNVANAGHPSFTEIAQNYDVTFLQPPESVLAEMYKRYGWTTQVMPKGTFKGQDADLRLPGTTTTLFASTRMSDDVAYTVVKTICEKTDRLQAAHKALAKFDCANGVWKEDVNGMPLHDGAARYYRERGWLK